MTSKAAEGQPERSGRGNEETVVHIDKEPYKVTRSEMTVRELLELAGEEPSETSLVLRHGNEQQKYASLNEVVPLRNGMHFVVYHNTPTTVS